MSDFTTGELFEVIDQMRSELEQERKRNQALSEALQQSKSDKEAQRPRHRPGQTPEQVANDRDVTHEQRKQAFSALLDQRWDEAKDKARHPLTGGLLDGPGT